MASGIELASAWVRLTPTLEGVTDEITKQFLPGVGAAEKEGDKAGKGWGAKVKAGIGAAAIVTGVVAAFKGLYEVGDTFDAVTDTIRAGTGLQGEALDGLVASAKKVGQNVPADFEAVGTTLADLNTRLGLTGGTLETVSSQYLEAGRVLGSEVDIGATTAAFSAFKIEGDNVVGAMDTLFQVSQATGVGMNELAAGVQANAPALQNLGFTFEDSIALLGSLDKAGLNSTQMMSSMSKGLVTLAKDGEEPEAAFKRVTGEIQGFVDTGDTASALDLAAQIFGTRGASQFVGALQSGVMNMDDLMAATGATGDTILGVGEETMDFAEKAKMTMNTAMVAIEPLATAVFTAIGDGLSAAMPFLQDLGAWVGENTGAIGVIAGAIGVTLVGAFIAWTASVWASTIALLANPITWIVLAIVALIAAVVALVMNWDTVVAWITEVWAGFIAWITSVIEGFVVWWGGVWQGIVDFFVGVWTSVSEYVAMVWEGIIAFFTSALQWIVDMFMNWTIYGIIISNWDAIAAFFVNLWNGIVAFIQGAIQIVSDVISAVTSAISAIWQNIWSGIGSFFSSIWNGIIYAVQGFGNFFRDAFSGIAGFVQNAFAGVLGAVKGPINGIISIVNSAIRALNGLSISIPDWVPGVGGQTWGLSLPTIPQLALGATVLPRAGGTLAILAEAGRPESVVDTGLMNRALEEGLGSGSDRPAYVNLIDADGSIMARLRTVADQAVDGGFSDMEAARRRYGG